MPRSPNPTEGGSEADARTRTGDPFITSSERIRAAAGRLRVSPEEPGDLGRVCGSLRVVSGRERLP